MARSKQKKFADFNKSKYAFDYKNEIQLKLLKEALAKWDSVVVELGCGKGAYTIALAEKNEDGLFLGVDIQGERLAFACKAAEDKKLSNCRFFRAPIQRIDEFLEPSSIDSIWLTFPDPFPRLRQAKRRLTSLGFLQKYKEILKYEGIIHLKTDSFELANFTKEQIDKANYLKAITDIYNVDSLPPDHEARLVQTDFEKKHRSKGATIYYLSARLIEDPAL